MLTALYDGKCRICQSTRATVSALDWLHRIEFLDLHDSEAFRSRCPALDAAQLLGEIHVIDSQSQIYAGYYGTRRMLRELPLGWSIWLLLHLPGMDWLGIRVYRFIARHRYRINRLLGGDPPDCPEDACQIP